MARIQFADFDDAVFATRLVCPAPLHPGAHTDNVQLLQLASQARMQFFAQWRWRESDVAGVRVFVGDQAVQYRAEAFPHQAVEVQMAVRDIAAKGFDLVWRLVDADSGTLLALGKIGVVCVDPHSKRPCALPEALRQRLQQLQPLLAEASAGAGPPRTGHGPGVACRTGVHQCLRPLGPVQQPGVGVGAGAARRPWRYWNP